MSQSGPKTFAPLTAEREFFARRRQRLAELEREATGLYGEVQAVEAEASKRLGVSVAFNPETGNFVEVIQDPPPLPVEPPPIPQETK